MMIKKRCHKINCRNFVENVGDTYCSEHKGETNRQYNKFRETYDKEYVSFYHSKSWKAKRKQALRRDNYLCQRCLNEFEIITISEEVHHIISTKEDWSKKLELDNLISLCTSCHQQIESKR